MLYRRIRKQQSDIYHIYSDFERKFPIANELKSNVLFTVIFALWWDFCYDPVADGILLKESSRQTMKFDRCGYVLTTGHILNCACRLKFCCIQPVSAWIQFFFFFFFFNCSIVHFRWTGMGGSTLNHWMGVEPDYLAGRVYFFLVLDSLPLLQVHKCM